MHESGAGSSASASAAAASEVQIRPIKKQKCCFGILDLVPPFNAKTFDSAQPYIDQEDMINTFHQYFGTPSVEKPQLRDLEEVGMTIVYYSCFNFCLTFLGEDIMSLNLSRLWKTAKEGKETHDMEEFGQVYELAKEYAAKIIIFYHLLPSEKINSFGDDTISAQEDLVKQLDV
jgi:hypothetical protein